MCEQQKISFEELNLGCFSQVESVRAGKFKNGTYCVRYAYRHDANPHKDQILWILYNRKSLKPIKTIINHVKSCMEEWDKKCVFIDDYDSNKPDLAVEVSMLSDGHGTFCHFRIEHDKGGVANIGVIVGQGRFIDVDDDSIVGALHVLLANALGPLKNDEFLKVGVEKLEMIRKWAEDHGLKPQKVSRTQNGTVLFPKRRETT